MFISAPTHRLFLLTLASLILVPVSASAVDTNKCLTDATKDRTKSLSDAYKTYDDLMEDLLKKFGDEESKAYRVTDDSNYRSGSVYLSQSSYTRQMEEANRNLNTRVQQIWTDFNSKSSLCNGGTYNYSSSYSNNTPRYQQPNSAYNFVYPQSYSYPSYQYPYPSSYQYSYPYSYQYSYPYTYGNYYQYPQYDYLIYPYGNNSSYVRRPANYQTDPYASPYYRGRGSCRTPNIQHVPNGCVYKFSLDEEGCYEYKLDC